MAEASQYTPGDPLSLWWVGDPAQPRLIGELRLVTGQRSVALTYDRSWLTDGFALSEDLPLTAELFVPKEKDVAVGAVDDARPDRWGERVIRQFEQCSRLSILEFLLFAGDDRYGALGVSRSAQAYQPWATAPLPGLASLAEMSLVVRKVLANEPVPELQRRLVRPGVSLGGARPKSLLSIEGAPWLVKFSEGEDMDTELIEHAAMTLSATCGVHAAPTRALDVDGRHAVAIRRFDRVGARRLHAVSAKVALLAAGEDLGYPQLAQLLRRLAPAASIAQEQEQLFRRMVFNILIDNTDDHEKNHALLRQADGSYLLAPAFDVVPSAQGLGYQALPVGDSGAEATMANALSQVRSFGLKPAAARDIVEEIARRVDGWKRHFSDLGVRDADLQLLAQYLDGDRLGAQRREFAAGRRIHQAHPVRKRPG
ncbi:MAG: type II toxin-antitoxin system HipA family toxin [Ramlibacter sp.]|nr:type II toxin-antitoxin system HipA family toxin [Ramlibacter sp.]